MNKEDFINKISNYVILANQKRGNPLYNSVVIAQGCLETGYGASNLMMKANAIFGIKATSSWKGKVYNANTKECYDGVNMTNVSACFRAYDSIEESVNDYFNLICNSERYKKAKYVDSKEECIKQIRLGGYATDPNYENSVLMIILTNNLTKFDTLTVQTVDNSVENLAKDVIAGKYGNGEERKQKLGDKYNEVQNLVNKLLKGDQKTEQVYIVKRGDTLTKIANKYNTSVEKLAKDNNIKNPNLIFINQRIVIK